MDELSAAVLADGREWRRFGDVEDVTFVFGRAKAAAMVLDKEELPGRESGRGAAEAAAVVKDVLRDVGVGVGS